MSWILWALVGVIGLVIVGVVVKKLTHKEDDIFSRGANVSSKFSDCCKKISNFFGGGA